MASRTSSSSSAKPTLGNWIIFLVAVALVAALFWGVWVGLNALAPLLGQWLNAFATLPPALSAAVVAGLVSIVVSPLTVTLTKWWERKWIIEQEHRASKRPVYETFMAFWMKVLGANRPGGQPVPQEEIVASLSAFNEKLIVWGSADVIRSYAMFRHKALQAAAVKEQIAASEGSSPEDAAVARLLAHTTMVEALKGFEKLLFAIRADLGHSPKGLKERDLLRVFVNDIDDGFDAEKALASDK